MMIVQALSSIESMPAAKRPHAFMGFDGFVDTIARVAHGEGEAFASMSALGAFLLGRKEGNCALRLEGGTPRMGGNMPNCAHALASLGIPVDCVGAMGDGSPEPAFASMSGLCSLHPVAMPGQCLALEFADSKLFLADMGGPRQMSWEGIEHRVGAGRLAGLAAGADLLGLFNWGELPNMHDIWEHFADSLLASPECRAHTAVFDLSDCSSRSAQDIRAALALLSRFRSRLRVVLSANDSELETVAHALGLASDDPAAMGRAVAASGAMDALVHHSLAYARVFGAGGAHTVNGIHIDNPVLVTGGGDHFNAGLCLGLMAGLSVRSSALVGNTVSRLYVSSGESPGLAAVLHEIETADVSWEEEA